MPIPIATTTVAVWGKRPQSPEDPDSEGYDDPPSESAALATGIRASITLPNARRGELADMVNSYTMRMDLFSDDLTQYDFILDESTSTLYKVETVIKSIPEAFGLSHWKATLKLTKGINSGGESLADIA